MGPTVVYINHRNLQHNIGLIRQAVGQKKIMAVVKANAYGHGDVEVATTALQNGCEYLGVSFVEEGIRLRQAKITAPILVFGAHLNNCLAQAVRYKLEMTVTADSQISYLKKISEQFRVKIPVHLKVDTGMNRVGYHYENFERGLNAILQSRYLQLKGVYSHFSTSEDNNPAFARLQIKRFDEVRSYIQQQVKNKILFHMANSGAIMKFPQSYYDMVRPGILLYGCFPASRFAGSWRLKEVMSLESSLSLIKFVRKNESISYGRRYITKENTYIGVIPIGYADGFSWQNTNQAEVLIKGTRYPLVGAVCMDMVMVNLGKKLNCKIGDKVVIYGHNGRQSILINEVADRLKTIAYEVTCGVSPRVLRIHLYA
jgi:alanine racemase